MSGPIPVDAKNAVETAKAIKAGELPPPAKSLAEALARIYADGGRYVQKTGQMQGSARYSYAKEGDFIATIRPLMETHGVTIRPIAQQVVTNETFQRASGAVAYRVVILATFEFLHASGDAKLVQAFGEGQDSGDKAFNKAMTGAMKYALRQTFCVETGDDPDDTPSSEQQRKPVPQSKPQPQPQQQPRKPEPAGNVAKDNMQLRAKHAQAYGASRTHAEYLAARKSVVADVERGHLSEADVAALRKIDAETVAKFPAPAKA